MKKIRLTQGKFAIVDDEDYELVAPHRWYTQRSGTLFYARTSTLVGRTDMHRHIMRARKGVPIDHVNGNGLDNRRANLRFCSTSQNVANGFKHRDARLSRYKGVTWHRQCGRWQAQLQSRFATRRYLGLFTDEKAAARAYDAAAVVCYGEFARLNFPRTKSRSALRFAGRAQ